MEINNLIIIYLLVLIIVPVVTYFIASSLNKKHLWNYPEYKSYTWGYFQGIGALFYSVIGFVSGFLIIFLEIDAPTNQILLQLAFSTFFLFVGFSACSKQKWALVLITIFSLFPPIWIINYFYIKKRPYLAKNYHHRSTIKSENKINDQLLNEKNEERSDKVESSSKNNDSIEQLEKIKKLLDDGAITLMEYDKLKQKIMSEL
ncbi:SHOCT domain-containing protein [Candidatus Pseudothioglobus singularis]|nr:SHOCT domain-containing protein [Candidatus Pseudothioglobus singularis]